jgi:hypothetical protein
VLILKIKKIILKYFKIKKIIFKYFKIKNTLINICFHTMKRTRRPPNINSYVVISFKIKVLNNSTSGHLKLWRCHRKHRRTKGISTWVQIIITFWFLNSFCAVKFYSLKQMIFFFFKLKWLEFLFLTLITFSISYYLSFFSFFPTKIKISLGFQNFLVIRLITCLVSGLIYCKWFMKCDGDNNSLFYCFGSKSDNICVWKLNMPFSIESWRSHIYAWNCSFKRFFF